MADYRLDMIMNFGKIKRQAKPEKHDAVNRLHKSFQILSNRVLTSEDLLMNVEVFSSFLESKFDDIISEFLAKKSSDAS
jgi:hypothetical protein